VSQVTASPFTRMAQWIELMFDRLRTVGTGWSQVIRMYQPWPAPVQAASYRDASVLPEIDRWVATLREHGRIAPDVHFDVRQRGPVLVGVLRDRSGEHELEPGAFLVFGHGGLQVLDERSFFRIYHAP
jgi:hypothetical protein